MFLVSTVEAADVVTSTSVPDNQPLVTDQPNLISTEGNSTSDNPTLVAPRENTTALDTSITGGEAPADNSLLSTKTASDNTVYFVTAAALLGAIVVGLCIVVICKRRA